MLFKNGFAVLLSMFLIFIGATETFAQNQNYIGDNKIYYGTAYYPEAWDLENMDQDIERMKELNMNVMRIAEFSWALMEPEEGEFQFDWLHHVIEKLHANDIDVILGTPTATPPAWMAEKYPEIFNVTDEGYRKTHGARRNCSYTSEIYKRKSRIIVKKMAKEFGDKPGVIAWQIDNEFHFSPDFSDRSKNLWQKWLKDRYNTIDSLNKAWNTVLWSQRYNSFDQIPLPRDYVWHHPSLRFNHYRFLNEKIQQYQQLQVEAIRKYSDIPITHDGMPGQELNYAELFKNLDFFAVNNYHSFEVYDRIQSNYDRARSYNNTKHWLFETAPNYSGGGSKGQTWFLHQREGSMQAALWMNYALGAQGSLFWLWKQHWAGQEMPHGHIISSWNEPAANYEQLKELGQQLSQTSDFQMDAPVAPAQTAIYYSHRADMGFRIEEYANGIEYYDDWTYRFYRPIANGYLHRDVIYAHHDLDQYKLVFAPLFPYIPKATRQKLKKWVHNGGTLVLGPMSGYRNKEWASFKDHALGDLEDWIGIHVDSRIPIGTERREAEIPFMIDFTDEFNIDSHEGRLWSDALSSEEGKIIARYRNGMHDGEPAIIESDAGQGKVVLLGVDPGKEAYKQLAVHYAKEQGISPLATGDEGVVVAPRKGNDQKASIIVNICDTTNTITVPFTGRTDLFTGEKQTSKTLELAPYEKLFLVDQ